MSVRHAFAARLSTAALLLAAPAAADFRDKVDPWIAAEITRAGSGEAEFLIVLDEQADLSGAAGLSSKLAKGTYVFERLTALAERSQAPLRVELARAGIPYRPFWIVNMIWAKGNAAAVASLAARHDVARIVGNPRVGLDLPRAEATLAPAAPEAVEWNITKVNADDVWAMGFTGVGAVIGGQDTGYDWDHPALLGKYRGWNGASANHNFHWHDAIHSGGGVCGANATEPCDDDTGFNGHGTHTMGTMVGDDGSANQIGMAPGAKWIGCRNMDQGNGTPATYTECYQWFLAPTDLAGQNPNPALSPDVINNSWGCPISEGCVDPNVMKTVVENLRAAGILSVHSAGNSGSSCSSVDTPSAIYDASFTIGNTTSTDALNSGSSRGPVTSDGSNRRKPDVSAPGTSVRSSKRGGTYGSGSGTSMAGPHVAGLVALLIDADEALRGNVDALEELIRESAFTGVTASGSCGGIPVATIPNNHFGWGRIDALAAVQLRQSGFLFADGFETGLTDDWSSTSPAP
jgi:subtilisin family serine protease